MSQLYYCHCKLQSRLDAADRKIDEMKKIFAEMMDLSATEIMAVERGNQRIADLESQLTQSREPRSLAILPIASVSSRSYREDSKSHQPKPARRGSRMPESTVNSIPDEKLLERAVKNARNLNYRKGQPYPRWTAIADAFALGSTYAAQLCRRFGLDPDEMVKR